MIQNPWFQAIAPPAFFLAIGVFANRLGRRDGDDSPRRNDWAVSTTVMLMTLGKVTADLIGRSEPANTLLWMLGILFAVFVSIEHDRYRTWVKDDEG